MEYYRTDVPKGKNINKSGGLQGCIFGYYYYYYYHFLKVNFKIIPNVCGCCQHMTKAYMIIGDISIATVQRNDCRIHIWRMTKDESVNSMKNTDLILKGGQLWLWKNKWFIILMTNIHQKLWPNNIKPTMEKTEKK